MQKSVRHEALTTVLQRMENDLKESKNREQNLHRELIGEKGKRDIIRAELRKLRDTIVIKENDEEERSDKLYKIKTKRNIIRTELRRLKDEIEKNEYEEEMLSDKLDKVKEERNDIRTELRHLVNEMEQKENQERKQTCVSYEKRKTLQTVKDQREKLQEQINVTTSELDDLRQQLKSEELRQQLDACLQSIRLTNKDKNSIVRTVLPLLVEKMRQTDCLFRRMYKCPVFTSSYYENLTSKDVGKFAINLVLDLPIEEDFIMIIQCLGKPEYANLFLNVRVEKLAVNELRLLLDKNGYVVPGQLLRWFQRVVDVAKLNDLVVEGVEKINLTDSGPEEALHIQLTYPDGTCTLLELVPVFGFLDNHWPKDIKDARKKVINGALIEYRYLYLVPEVYQRQINRSPRAPPNPSDTHRMWRMLFPDILKEDEAILVIKLLKMLRDSQKWDNLHSYYLKTLVLNDIADNPDKDWNHSLLDERLLEMMSKLKDCLDNKTLPHFFFPTVNLFQYMDSKEMELISEKLGKMREIGKDPSLVQRYFKV